MKAGRDEPENGQDRSDRRIPYFRPDDGVSSSGSSRLADRLHASELPNRARTIDAEGKAHIASMVQVELRRPCDSRKNPGPSNDRTGTGGEGPGPTLRCMSL